MELEEEIKRYIKLMHNGWQSKEGVVLTDVDCMPL
jgi:hypothetical protein